MSVLLKWKCANTSVLSRLWQRIPWMCTLSTGWWWNRGAATLQTLETPVTNIHLNSWGDCKLKRIQTSFFIGIFSLHDNTRWGTRVCDKLLFSISVNLQIFSPEIDQLIIAVRWCIYFFLAVFNGMFLYIFHGCLMFEYLSHYTCIFHPQWALFQTTHHQ